MYRFFNKFAKSYVAQNYLGNYANCLPVLPATFYESRNRISAKFSYRPEFPILPKHNDQLSAIHFVNFLQTKLNSSKDQAANVYSNFPELISTDLSDMSRNVTLLQEKGVTRKSILDNPWMLNTKYDQVEYNLEIIEKMEPKNINDFAPLIRIAQQKLKRIQFLGNAEKFTVPHKHRIYYLSELMKLLPSVVSTYLSEKPFVFVIRFEVFDRNLKLMLQHIDPIDILKDPWVFRYNTSILEARILKAIQGNKTKIMPWMLRCSERNFLKSMKITADEKALLGENSLVKYLSDRLAFDIPTTELIIRKHPKVLNVRATRMKEILDYLLGEAGFTAMDIAQVPRIFCHSLKTTKKRILELQSHGCRPQSLVVVCKSSKEYKKHLNRWIVVREQLKEQNIISDE